jgi:hypothetical protein
MIGVVRIRARQAVVAAVAIVAVASCGDGRREARQETTSAAKTSSVAPARSDSPVGAETYRPPLPARRSESTASGKGKVKCAGVYLNVTLRAEALNAGSDAESRERALRDAATRLVAPVKDRVGTPELSPAIRAFRVVVRDTSATTSIAERLRASPDVEDVVRDACNVRIS